MRRCECALIELNVENLMKLRAAACVTVLLMAFSLIFSPLAHAQEEAPQAQTLWRLLDYIAVDYPAAVDNGKVISELEFAEMREFADTVAKGMTTLTPTPTQNDLILRANALVDIVSSKASPDDVAKTAHTLADLLITAYPVPLAPSKQPDLALGEALYVAECAACHGLTGQGNGPQANDMRPPPIAFTDTDRANHRSIFALYQVISQGLDGTAMQGFGTLSPKERWALAFYVGGLAYSDADVQSGKRFWEESPQVRDDFPDLKSITQSSAASLTAAYGNNNAMALIAFLRKTPQVASRSADNLLEIARTRLSQTTEAYRNGQHKRAGKLALSSYLDGFEPIEPILKIKDIALMRDVETTMIELRGLISKKAPVSDIDAKAEKLQILFDAVETRLGASKTGNGASFIAAFTILLREGVEALLIVVAMLAFLGKADRTKEIRYVHAGWVLALIAGVLTWVAASSFISISGASRELTEGIGALLAALVLVFVGIWMQGKSQAAAWQKYIREKMTHALSRQSAWVLFLLAFVVVYREVFEVILFLIALWNQGNAIAILSGLSSAIATLGVIAWVFMKYSKRLPITQFFLYSSMLMAVLAVVLAGKGIAALQEAGWLGINQAVWLPRVEIIGIYPTWQGLAGQALVLATLLIAFWMNDKKQLASNA
jgi:high-affinity iron transporter